MLGLTPREVRLAERVREMEQQNQLLRRQLSISQNQLIQAWGNEGEDGAEKIGEGTGTGEQGATKCKEKVRKIKVWLVFLKAKPR